LCLWSIRQRSDLGYAVTLLIGAMTNETVLVLASAFFFFNAERFPTSGAELWRVIKVALRTLALTLPAVGFTVFIRYVTRDNEHLGGAWHLPDNLHGIRKAFSSDPLTWHRRHYTYFVFIFGPLWLYAYMGWRKKPLFMRAASLMVPLFLAGNMLTGIILESRQMLPLGAVIIPMALWSFIKSPQAIARG
jgi:hypothetical protein